MEAGNFREDLYYRIKGLTIATTSLSERQEDINSLVNHFTRLYNTKHQTDLKIHPDACRWFINTHWLGNVRELKNTLESAAAICLNNEISLQEIQLIRGESTQFNKSSSETDVSNLPLEDQVKELEIRLIKYALEKNQNNKTHSAQALGITRQGLINKIKRYQLE